VADFRRGRRNELIHRLREQGSSLRRIGHHPEVQLSAARVHAILQPDAAPGADAHVMAQGQPANAAIAADWDASLLNQLMTELYLEDGSVNRLTMYRLHHLSCVSDVLPREEWKRLRRRLGYPVAQTLAFELITFRLAFAARIVARRRASASSRVVAAKSVTQGCTSAYGGRNQFRRNPPLYGDATAKRRHSPGTPLSW
jgi:hypothetical protein